MILTFKDLLEKYKNHEPSPDKTKHIETELKKYETITDYYSGLDDLDLGFKDSALEENRTETKSVKKAMRRRNLMLKEVQQLSF